MRVALNRASCLSIAIVMLSMLYMPASVSADILTKRRVVIGDSNQSAVTSHTFQFVIDSYDTLGSIKFEYCDNTPYIGAPCTVPAGLTVYDAQLTEQQGETGFAIDASTNNTLVIRRTASAASGAPVNLKFDNITNPSEVNKITYVRISTYASEDATGTPTNEGAVMFGTTRPITVTGYVPPYLIFCVGVTVEINCSSGSGSQLNFGEFSRSQTKALSSQYSGSTNDPGGYTTSVIGTTMTSGSNSISGLNQVAASKVGTSQFGMNLRANTNPVVGSDPDGPGVSQSVPEVSSSNQFFFDNQILSRSVIPSDYKRFTSSYIVNIGADQKPGIYTTTLTYVAVAAF